MGAPEPNDGSNAGPTHSGGSPGTVAAAGGPGFAVGTILARRFEIVRYIARGGMGEVYEAIDLHTSSKKHFALKTLLPEVGRDLKARQRFEREVEIAREVRHPNVCPTYDLFQHVAESGVVLFLTMKLLEGEPLSALLSRHKDGLPVVHALPLLRQMAAGLDAAHAAGVVHRDFKPVNVMIDSSELPPTATITDFGISRLFELHGNTLTGTGRIIGTPGYIAPEIMMGEAPGPASDVYAFGLVMRSMIEKPPPLVWQQTIDRCLDPDPRYRPQRASEAVAMLEAAPRVAAPLLVEATKRLPVVVEPPPPASRRRFLVWGGAAAAAAAAAAGGTGLWYEWPRLFHPLPDKRFVALMAWPVGQDAQNRGLLRNVLDAVELRLRQAEQASKEFLVISSADPRSQAGPVKPAEAGGLLGANLVLAASITQPAGRYELSLQVMDPSSSRVIRSSMVKAAGSALSDLIDRACKTAAQLLDVPVVHAASTDEDELAGLPGSALKVFTEAEDALAQPNDAGLDEAIEKYKKVLEQRPRFGLGNARIALAYRRKYFLTRDRAFLEVASDNADLARKYNPASAKARLSTALVLLGAGKPDSALEILNGLIREDPTIPLYAACKADALHDLGRPKEEEATYRQIIANRPNYWPAHNDLGYMFWRDRRYEEALREYARASAVAPQVALPLANQGSIYLALGRKTEAADFLQRSIALAKNDYAYTNLGTVYSLMGDFKKALDSYNKARDLRPSESENWRNVADCQSKLGNPTAAREAYAKAASIAEAQVQTNPKRGPWMLLAFYRAKAGDRAGCDAALREGERQGALDLESEFFKAQALAATGHREGALKLVLELLKRGLSTVEVELALDLDRVREDPRYKSATERKKL